METENRLLAEEELLTIPDVAHWLHVSGRTVIKYYTRGDLKVVRLPGGQVRFKRAVVEKFIEQRSTAS